MADENRKRQKREWIADKRQMQKLERLVAEEENRFCKTLDPMMSADAQNIHPDIDSYHIEDIAEENEAYNGDIAEENGPYNGDIAAENGPYDGDEEHFSVHESVDDIEHEELLDETYRDGENIQDLWDEIDIQNDINNEYFDIEDLQEGEEKEDADMKSILRDWCNKFKISRNATEELLQIMNKYNKSLPKSAKTLLNTPENSSEGVAIVSGSEFFYFGFERVLSDLLECYPELENQTLPNGNLLHIIMNIDGLPLFKSTKAQFWPILCTVSNLVPREVVVVGIFYGKKKTNRLAIFGKHT